MTETEYKDESIPFYPDHVRTEFYVVLGIMAIAFVIGIAGLIKPVGIGDPADPMNTPLHVKPEWYFLGLYQLLKFIPKTIGAVMPVIALILLMLWPFFDRKADRSRNSQRTRLIVVILVVFLLVALTVWGEVS